MKPTPRIIVVLTLISALSAGLVTVFAIYTQPYIERNAKATLNQAVGEVLVGIDSFTVVSEEETLRIYQGKDKAGKLVGYAVYAVGSGFQDKIALIFGVSPDFSHLLALTILDQKDTPGLGAKITEQEPFLQFWPGRTLSRPIVFVKPPKEKSSLADNEVNAISGATISSRSVVGIVNQAVARAKAKVGAKS